MQVTTIEHYVPEPGTLLEWRPAPSTRDAVAAAPAVDVPPSFNQWFHLQTAARAADGRCAPGVWLALAFDLPGRLDPVALDATFAYWIRRHETLRSGFRGTREDPERFVVPKAEVALIPGDVHHFTSAPGLRAHLRSRLDEVCDPLSWPGFVLAAIVRSTGFTVFCGFDHRNVDGYSLAIAVHELATIYLALSAGEPLELPAAGSFIEYCALENARQPPGPDDPAMIRWGRFLDACGGTTPAFPLQLGVRPGFPRPQTTSCRRLLDRSAVAGFEALCRKLGGSVFTGVLAAAALALRRRGAGGDIRLVTPMHTRTDPRWAHTIGWLTTVAPLTLCAREDRFAMALRSAVAEFRAAREAGADRMPVVLPALGDRFRRTRDDVFMVSYTDYRGLRGSEQHAPRRAQHISNVTVADDAQFWVSRTHEGLFLRARYPDTPEAHQNVAAFIESFTAIISQAHLTPAH
ncbi:Condensation domain-containing protein [Amycolatopsis marina]|uniref:Condensation domain-containing protein n=1 Tax=Amycolatopsis marina TaxID=490629 RepID=A0A1I1AKE1_9PSEU|nr:condensation domain-containing protein [Amycolatopsis marina]SFB36803.1 Condensation domain-containing protein [Amycolatopsis marina]